MNLKALFVAAATLTLANGAHAAPLTWTDWTSANTTTAAGTLGSITVGFIGAINPAAQANGGFNYWNTNPSIYTPTGAENAPGDSDIIRLTGGTSAGTQTITFSQAVVNPIMAILSMGQTGVVVDYAFDTPFDILNQGVGHFGGGPNALTEEAGDVLRGREGHGLIQFQGTVTSISWTIPNAEFWHGFQIGYVDAEQMAPIPIPASGILLLAALGGLGLARRRV